MKGMAALRAVVVGAGGRARSTVLPALQSMREDVEVAALVELDEARLADVADRFRIPGRFADLDAFAAAGPECDVGFVVTPQGAHREPFVRLVDMGLHVHCEKPLAETLADAEAMAEAAQKTARVTMIGFDRRFSCILETMRELGERVSQPAFVHVSKSKPGPPTMERVLIENAVHSVDMLRFLVPGPWSEVVGAGTSFDPYGVCEERIASVIRFESGTIGTFHQVRRGGGWIERIEAYGDGWTAVADMPHEVTLMCPGFTPSAVREGRLVPVTGSANRFRVAGGEGIGASALRAFLRAVKEGGSAPVSVEDALMTQRLVDAILRGTGLAPL